MLPHDSFPAQYMKVTIKIHEYRLFGWSHQIERAEIETLHSLPGAGWSQAGSQSGPSLLLRAILGEH